MGAVPVGVPKQGQEFLTLHDVEDPENLTHDVQQDWIRSRSACSTARYDRWTADIEGTYWNFCVLKNDRLVGVFSISFWQM